MNVKRYTKNEELDFTVEFVTPCFLGGADGKTAELRSAPFKNLLRRWWRITKSNLPAEELWKKESELFGSTEKKDNKSPFGKSKVSLISLPNPQIKIGEDYLKELTYLGFGPITNNGTRKFIAEGSKANFKLIFPKECEEDFINVLTLINLYGSIGSRSRKGFGSLKISLNNPEKKLKNLKSLRESLPELERKLDLSKNYPYGLICDEKGLLCWKTSEKDSVTDCLQEIQDIYKSIRFEVKKNCGLSQRFLGSTKSITLGKNNKIDRIPSQLQIKVNENNGKFSGRILHLQYNLSDELKDQKKVWDVVHQYLDANLTRFGGRK